MKNLIILLAIVVGLGGQHEIFCSSEQARAAASDGNFVPGELLIKYRSAVPRSSVAALNASIGATVKTEFSTLRWVHVKIPDGIAMGDAISAYRRDPNIESVQPNFIYRINVTPDDAQFSQLYGMIRISAPQAWETTTGDPNVVVAVIDTGIDKSHPDLAANVWNNPGEIAGNGIDDDMNGFVDDTYGWDFLNGDNDPADGHNHGTHCSGTIGGVGNNGIGVAGVNWNVRIMALKTHDDVVGGSTSVTVISTFNYVTMMKNRGINIRATSNSYGGPPEAGSYDQALKDAIDATGRAGVLNVFAAGNQLTVDQEENNDILPTYPGSYNSPSILAVAASDQNDNRASFSHYGATTVDVAAPGVGIRSTVAGGGYANLSGTSMATPHTAGAAALIAAAHPGLSAASIKATLMNTVDFLPQWSGFIMTSGRINVARAIAEPTVCNFGLSSYAMGLPVQGGTATFDVYAAPNCGFDAYSSEPWLRVTSDPGSGYGWVSFAAAPNPSLSARTGTLVVAGRYFTVTQSGNGAALPTSYVAGRVVNVDGDAITGARITIIDALGNSRQGTSDSAGRYQLNGVARGQQYTVVASHSEYSFESRQVVVVGNTENVDFVGRR